MIIKDKIWGRWEIKEEVLEELIFSPSLKRLDKIAQYGMKYNLYPLPGFTRYEHSIGVMLILRKLDAPIQEQISGLLHDVSHTAFSHLIDWVLGDRSKEDYQDNRHEEHVRNSEIPKILEKHHFNLEDTIRYDKYSLIEREAPHLCADRLDYGIREFFYWAAPDCVKTLSESLINKDGRIVFSSKNNAEIFAYNYMKLQREHWGGAEWTLRWQLFSDALKIALEKSIISLDDFSKYDDYIIEKLKKSGDRKIIETINRLSGKLNFEIIEDDQISAQYHLQKKFRYTDPEYIENGSVKRLTDESEEYRKFLGEQLRLNKKGIFLNLL